MIIFPQKLLHWQALHCTLSIPSLHSPLNVGRIIPLFVAYLLLKRPSRISFKMAFQVFTFSKKNSGGIGNLYTVVVIGRTRLLSNYNASFITLIITILIIFISNVIIIINNDISQSSLSLPISVVLLLIIITIF